MVDDHLVPTGYNTLLLETMRSHLKDSQFEFRNNVMALVKMAKEGSSNNDKKMEEANNDEEKES